MIHYATRTILFYILKQFFYKNVLECTLWTWWSPEFEILMFCIAQLASKPNPGLRKPMCWRVTDSQLATSSAWAG